MMTPTSLCCYCSIQAKECWQTKCTCMQGIQTRSSRRNAIFQFTRSPQTWAIRFATAYQRYTPFCQDAIRRVPCIDLENVLRICPCQKYRCLAGCDEVWRQGHSPGIIINICPVTAWEKGQACQFVKWATLHSCQDHWQSCIIVATNWGCLWTYALRALYQVTVWCRSHISKPKLGNPIGHGWHQPDSMRLLPTLYKNESAPAELRNITHLYCTDNLQSCQGQKCPGRLALYWHLHLRDGLW